MNDPIQPLSREDVKKAVERGNPPRIPLVRAKWWGEGLWDQYGQRLRELDRYPEDVAWLFPGNPVRPDRMDLPWTWTTGGAHDSACVIDDWAKLDDFIARLPNPATDAEFAKLAEAARKARAEDRYILYGWWGFFFEKPWSLRGMQNLLCDYYTDSENVHKLYAALCQTYCTYIEAFLDEAIVYGRRHRAR